MGTIKTTNIQSITGSGTVTIGQSGETITIPTNATLGASGTTVTVPSGATLDLSNATQTGVGGVNTPAFEAYRSGNQTMSSAVLTKVQINTEVVDTDSCYDNATNYRFTPTIAGKYYVYVNLTMFSTTNNTINGAIIAIYKNGSNYKAQDLTVFNNESVRETMHTSAIIDFNGSSDYVEFFAYLDVDSGTPTIEAGDKYCNFGAFKIIE